MSATATCPRSIDTPAWGLITCYLRADHGGMCQGDRPIAHPAGKPYYWYGNPQPVEAVIAAVEHAMFGAEEGGLVSDDDSLPVGELRRLLGELAGPRIAALIAEAEKRGAVKALRGHAAKCRDMAERHPEAAPVFRNYANDLDTAAAQVECGEVTL